MNQSGELDEDFDKELIGIHNSLSDDINLEYGDIISIHAPRNSDIHEHTFFITYIDETQIRLTNVSTLLLYELNISEEGNITDESIESIELLSRADESGYAKQNALVPKKWVDIHFGGDFPLILTGEITNLEEDMIEITTYPDLDVMYIDFEYKGIPKNLPIKSINIRKKPEQLVKIGSLVSLRGDSDELGESIDNQDKASMEMTDSGESVISIPEGAEPDRNIRDALHSLYIDANDIIFGEEDSEEIVQVVEIKESEKRYTIEAQVNSLMDELLSTIPNSQRTVQVLDNIHRIITRFKELRNKFSKFDENHNIRNPKLMGPDYKPLIKHIENMDIKLKWLLPVVQSKKKLYCSNDAKFSDDQNDGIIISYDTDLKDQSLIQEDFYENKTQTDSVKYKEMIKRMNPYMTPFESQSSEYNLQNHISVLANLESIVDNLENFESTVVNRSELAKRKYVIQRYNMGTTMLEPEVLKTGRRVFIRKNISPNDNMAMKSLITMPRSVVKYSKTELSCTSIMERSSLAQNPPLLFRILKSRLNIEQYIVDQFEKDIDYEKMAEATQTQFLSTMKEYVLDETLAEDNDKLEKLLKVIIPNSRNLIRLIKPYIQDKLSLVEIVKELEPFMVYVEDITYNQYMEIRYFIKERLTEIKKSFAQKTIDYSIIKTTKYLVSHKLHGIERVLHDMGGLLDTFIAGYKMDYLNKSQNKQTDTTYHHQPSELLSSIMMADNGQLMQNLIIQNNLQLFIPEEFIDALQPVNIGDMGRIEKIRATDCNRRFLTKRYSSLHELQNDNHEETWYDKEFDDTPYDILKKYKVDQTKMSSKNFVEFLSENLIAKHDCPINRSVEMAQNIILGKKVVSDGEYAILEIRPTLPKELDESSLSPSEMQSITSEGDSRKIIHYYKRLKNNWIIDKTVDDAAFIDNNTLFCNMDKMCFKNQSNSVCEPIMDASERMKSIAKRKLLAEADVRYSKSVNDMSEDIDDKIDYYTKIILKSKSLKEIQLYKPNNYAYELGNFAETGDLIQSPYIGLRDFILSQDDFVKRQTDIHRLSSQFTRSPMVAELNEDPNWLYCKETNTKLLPRFFYTLARVYLNGDAYDYQDGQDEICRRQGELSDDGDSIVDKYSGYVIKKIEFSTDEGFDESGFKLTTNEIMQKDLKTVIEESLKNRDKVFENETTQHVYNIFITLCENLGIPSDGIEELIMRLSVEIIETNIKTEPAYEKYAEKVEKQKGKRPIPYIQYRNQTIILMVSASLLIGLQTVTPPYKPKITAPGCVRSFSGFPLDGGDENMAGLQYIACVVNKTKSSTVPWNSLKGMPLQIISGGIKKILAEMLIPRPDITELYIKKREYALLNPEETIPEEHNMVKWSRCLPPMVPYSVKKSLHNIPAEFRSDFIELMRNGNKDQRESLNVFKSKLMMYGYGVIEQINDVVSKKDVLLKTGANVAFLQNACCGDRNTVNAITYFIDEAHEIAQYLSVMENLDQVVNNTKELTQAPVFFHNINTMINRPTMPTEHFDTNIYAAFIYYCRFDRNIPVPEELRQLCSERPAGYNSNWSQEEKIKFLRENGKRFTIDQLHQLMDIIYNKNLVQGATHNTYSKIESLKEILEYLDENDSTVIDRRLISHLLSVISAHNPLQYVIEDNEQTEKLKNYLATSNKLMYESIYEFLDKYGNIRAIELEHLDSFITNITGWTTDNVPEKEQGQDGLYSIAQFIKNSVNAMTRVFPGMIINNIDLKKVPKHWNLSPFHQADISRFMQKYYEPINKFKKDKTLLALLKEVQVKLIDLNILMQHIPIYSPIHKGENTFYSLFDKQTVYALLKYLWYSVLYEYINMSDDPELLHTDIEENKSGRRLNIRNRADMVESLQTIGESDLDEEEADYMANMTEVSIKIGDLQDFKRRTAQLLVAFLEIDQDNKNSIDLTYNKISEKMNRSKQTEKKMITDFFRDMESDERQVKFLEKTYKMGRWNVGMQKGLVQYDKSTYDRERGEIIERLNGTNAVDDDVAIMERDIYEIEQDEAAAVEDEYDNEANDITELGEEYEDDYYGDEGGDGF